MIRSLFPSLQPEERADVVSDAVTKLIAAIRGGGADPSRRTAPYLVSIAKNRAVDLLRSGERSVSRSAAEGLVAASEPSDPDTEVVDLLRRLDSQEAIRKAMDRAREAGDHQVNTTVRIWLQLCDHRGREVSLRTVADVLGVSHTEVRRRLQKFGGYLDE